METNNQIKLQTFRYIYSDEFIKELEYFSKIHQYDERKKFKKEYQFWIEEENIKQLIENEKRRSEEEGYKGDFMDKIFKSTRYYYRKKKNQVEKEEINKKEEKNFMGLSKNMMRTMDQHIYNIIQKHIDKTMAMSKINPAKAFDDFCNKYMEEITDEIFRLKERIVLKKDEISMKFKKSYKNRFYKIRISMHKK